MQRPVPGREWLPKWPPRKGRDRIAGGSTVQVIYRAYDLIDFNVSSLLCQMRPLRYESNSRRPKTNKIDDNIGSQNI